MALDGATWRGVLVGSSDWPASNDVTGFPQYFARTRFETRGDAATGSGESAAIKLFKLAERLSPKFRVTPDSKGPPSTAGRFALVDDDGNEYGALVIDTSAPPSLTLEVRNAADGVVVGRVNLSGGTVELTNATNAFIRMSPSGDVTLQSRPGGSVNVNGVPFL